MNKQYPRVAILLAAYNGSKWIKDQLSSILSQKHINVDIYISVDRSSDCTLEILDSVKKDNSNVYILPYGERFGGAAKNFYRLIKDVDISGYDFVGFSDQDDIWYEDKIYHAINSMKIYSCKAYSSDVIALWPNGTKKIIKKSFPQKKYDFIFESAGPGCTYVFDKKCFKEFKNFLLINWKKVSNIDYHDWLAYSFFRSKGYKWIIDDVPKMFYRQHSNNQLGAKFSWRSYFLRLKLIKEGWYLSQIKEITKVLGFPNITWRFLALNFFQTRRRKLDIFFMIFFILFFKEEKNSK